MTLDEIAASNDVSLLWNALQTAKADDDVLTIAALKRRMGELGGTDVRPSKANVAKIVAVKDGRGVAVDQSWDPMVKTTAEQIAHVGN